MIQEIKVFECCFCKTEIKETKTDPIDINIFFNIYWICFYNFMR